MNKKRILLVLLFVLSITNVNAKYYEIGGDYLSDEEEQKIENMLNDINDKHKVNLSVVILGKDKKHCYKESNYIKCAIEKLGIEGNYVYTVNMGIKEETGKGDVNTFMNSSVQNTRELFSEIDMKRIQDRNLFSLKNGRFYENTNGFVKGIEEELNGLCEFDCDINKALPLYEKKKIEDKEKYAKNFNNIIEAIKVGLLTVISFILSLFGINNYAIPFLKNKKRIKELIDYKDIVREFKTVIEYKSNLLKGDKQKIIRELEELENKIRSLLSEEKVDKREVSKIKEKYIKIKEGIKSGITKELFEEIISFQEEKSNLKIKL